MTFSGRKTLKQETTSYNTEKHSEDEKKEKF